MALPSSDAHIKSAVTPNIVLSYNYVYSTENISSVCIIGAMRSLILIIMELNTACVWYLLCKSFSPHSRTISLSGKAGRRSDHQLHTLRSRCRFILVVGKCLHAPAFRECFLWALGLRPVMFTDSMKRKRQEEVSQWCDYVLFPKPWPPQLNEAVGWDKRQSL